MSSPTERLVSNPVIFYDGKIDDQVFNTVKERIEAGQRERDRQFSERSPGLRPCRPLTTPRITDHEN